MCYSSGNIDERPIENTDTTANEKILIQQPMKKNMCCSRRN